MKNTVKNNDDRKAKNEMDTVGSRLSIFLDKIGMSRKDIAQESDVVFSTVTNYLEKDELPGPKFLAHLVQRHRVNVDWLLSGNGPMAIEEMAQECRQLSANFNQDLESEVIDLRRELAQKDREFAGYMLEAARAADDARRWREKVLSAVILVARSLDLTSDQYRAIVDAVVDPLRAIADLESVQSHQAAAGE